MTHTDAALSSQLTSAATALLALLPTPDRASALTALSDPSWTSWSYLPGDRPGLLLEGVSADVLAATTDLLAASHSELGLQLVEGAMAVERERRRSITGEMPGGDRYWLRLHGQPGDGGTWSWRLNGHHVGVHVVVDGDTVTATPHFIGSEPAHLTQGDLAGSRLLGREEYLARELMALLRPARRERAISSQTAPDDILSAMDPVVDASVLPTGLRRAELDREQQEAFDALAKRYLDRLPAAYAQACWDEVMEVGVDEMAFAWAGGTAVGEGHYYCVRTPVFLIEYDNTQDDANHAHSVLRHLRDDFGGDALRRHLRESHGSGES